MMKWWVAVLIKDRFESNWGDISENESIKLF